MSHPRPAWFADPLSWVELFILSNLAFLGVDILVAHSANAFASAYEWIPIVFSVAATLLLVLAMLVGGLRPTSTVDVTVSLPRRLARGLGLLVGWGSIAVGVAGLVFHLQSDFFEQQTLRSLVYTAPFAAPLAYTGVGLLILLNRTVSSRTGEWARWVLLLTLGGFVGNFVLSWADHAQNGYFRPSEWAGVVSAACAVGILLAVVLAPRSRLLWGLTFVFMGLQVLVGLVGFGLHLAANLERPGDALLSEGLLNGLPLAHFATKFIYGTPVFAPLLFVNLALLGVLGLWGLAVAVGSEAAASARRDAVSPGPES